MTEPRHLARLTAVPDASADDGPDDARSDAAQAAQAVLTRLEREQALAEAAEARAAVTAARADASRLLSDARDMADRTWLAASESARREAQRIVEEAAAEAAGILAKARAEASVIRQAGHGVERPARGRAASPDLPAWPIGSVTTGCSVAALLGACVVGAVLGAEVAAVCFAVILAVLAHLAGLSRAGPSAGLVLRLGLPALGALSYLSVPATAPPALAPAVTVASLVIALWGLRCLRRSTL